LVDDVELIREATRGHMAAIEALFRRHVEKAVRLAYVITGDWALAEDAAQEAFLRTFRSLGSLRPDAPFLPWFTTVVLNEAKRVRERNKRHVLLGEPGAESPDRGKDAGALARITACAAVGAATGIGYISPEEAAIQGETRARVIGALWLLDENHRVPVALKYLLGFSERQIAALLDIPLTTVKSRLFVARRRLKDALFDERGDAECARIAGRK
jgi:RNA polymerase sigma-70 factor (ECF subfamily)